MKTLAIREAKNTKSFDVALAVMISINVALVLIALSMLAFTIL